MISQEVCALNNCKLLISFHYSFSSLSIILWAGRQYQENEENACENASHNIGLIENGSTTFTELPQYMTLCACCQIMSSDLWLRCC